MLALYISLLRIEKMGTEEVLMTDRPYGVFYYIWISIAIVNFRVTLTVVVCRSE